MNVIALSRLRDFWSDHPEAEDSLRAWHKRLSSDSFATYAELKETFSSVDLVPTKVGEKVHVFDVGGNKYRVITWIRYTAQTVFIKFV